jgi:hypothetical protein
MKKLYTLLFISFLFTELASAQTKFWVQFTNKTGTPYTVGNPSAFLSQRSIQRRQNQGIPITTRDLPVNPSYVQQVLATGNVQLRYTSRWFNSVSITTTDQNALTAIANLPFVSSVSAVARFKRDKEDVEMQLDNSLVYKTANSDNQNPSPQVYNYGQSYNQVQMINVDCMHNLGYHGEGMVIAVLDAGFYNVDTLPAFDSLFANNQILGTWDFVAGNSSVYEDNAHGEMVLSCIGGYLDGQLIGTAPKAKFWLLRTEDAPSEYLVEEDNWVAGAEFADSVGADILNTSLGYTTFDNSSQNHTYADMDGNTTRISIATDFAAAVGMIPVCSAGNSGSSQWYYISAPADADSVLAVGAVDGNEVLAGFSSRGPTFDGRIKPNTCAQGSGSIVASPSGGIQNANGTSFASPITCGAVACLWQANPSFTAMQVFNAILMSADRFTNPNNDYGYGIPDFCAANLLISNQSPLITTQDNLLSVAPNPFFNSVAFSFYSFSDQAITVDLIDVSGRLIKTELVSTTANTTATITLNNCDEIAAGIYTMLVKTNYKVFTVKLVKAVN